MSLPKGYEWEIRTLENGQVNTYAVDEEGDEMYHLVDEGLLRHYEGGFIAWVRDRAQAELILRAILAPHTLEVKGEDNVGK